MILLVALLAGLVAGLILARLQHRSWTAPPLQRTGLAVLAFIPQLVLGYLPANSSQVPDSWAAAGLIVSLLLFLVFCWVNRRISGVWLLALGLILNLLVMALNRGFMPISPQSAGRLVSPETLAALASGSRFGTKDILLPPGQTNLVWLSDVFLPPAGFPYQVAFSLGDIVIAVGAFWVMLSRGKPSQIPPKKLIE